MPLRKRASEEIEIKECIKVIDEYSFFYKDVYDIKGN